MVWLADWEFVSNMEEREEGSFSHEPWEPLESLSASCPSQATRRLPALTCWNLRGGDCLFA